MTTYTREFCGEAVERGNTVLRGVSFVSNATRNQTSIGYHRLDVGLKVGSNVTWVGAWDQRTQRVDEGVAVDALNADRRGMRLQAGVIPVVKVTMDGTPLAQMDGSRVDFLMGLVGGSAGRVKPLLSSGAGSSVERQINDGGLSEWAAGVALADPSPAGVYAATSHSATTHSVTSGTYANGLVSVTLTMPDWATIGYVHVTVNSTVIGNGGAGSCYVVIYDGATTYGEQAITTSATASAALGACYAGSISATTTFRPQFKQATNNVDILRQTISVMAYWL